MESEALSVLRKLFPFRAKVTKGNPYGIPVGQEFLCARKKEGNASPYPIEVFSFAGSYRRYQFAEDEIELTPCSGDSGDLHQKKPGQQGLCDRCLELQESIAAFEVWRNCTDDTAWYAPDDPDPWPSDPRNQ